MLFVIFILGTLFAVSMAFLALLRTDSQTVAAKKLQFKLYVIIDGLSAEIGTSLTQSVMGRGAVLAGLDGDPCMGTDDTYVAAAPYLQATMDCTGLDTDADGVPESPDGAADNIDEMSQYAVLPGVHALYGSIEPYDSGLISGAPWLNLEYFAVTDLYRAWDSQPDVHGVTDTNGDGIPDVFHPTVPLSHPLRIRALDEGVPGSDGPFTDALDATVDARTRHGALSDSDGDGVVDSIRYRLGYLGGGEPDWFPAGTMGDEPEDGITSTDANCTSRLIVVPASAYSGRPSFTGGPPTPLPCDDLNDSGSLDLGTAYTSSLRRDVAAQLRDPEAVADAQFRDDIYVGMRVVPHGALVDLNHAHRTLVDNLFGLNTDGVPFATSLASLPYGPAVERRLRNRWMLSSLRPSDSLSALGALGEDMLADGGRNGSLFRTIFGAIDNNVDGDSQWYSLTAEPGDQLFNVDWAGRWMNPFAWQDVASVGPNTPLDYDIHHLLTTSSTDDLFMRNGLYNIGGIPAVLLTNLTDPALPRRSSYDPAGDPIDLLTWSSIDPVLNPDGDSALMMYPGYDPTWFLGGDVIISDRSFTDPITGLPKVPLTLQTPNAGATFFGARRDPRGNVLDPRFGKMQFALHSIGDINFDLTNPGVVGLTQREIQTVRDYFTVMLRNVTNAGALTVTTTLEDAIHDQAAQLTANFIDFADYDSGAANTPPGPPGTLTLLPGGMNDYPTEVQSRTGRIYYGFENQPFISEVFARAPDYAVELINPYPVPLNLGSYFLRVVDTMGVESVAPIALSNSVPANGYVHFYNGTDPGPGGVKLIELVLADDDIVQLVRKVPSRLFGGFVGIVVDEFKNEAVSVAGNSRQRDTNAGGRWRAVVPRTAENPPRLGFDNWVDLSGEIAPVHAVTDSRGLESAYPTTGSLLLLMRYAHSGSITFDPSGLQPRPSSMTSNLGAKPRAVDNGHMPVFDTAQMAQVAVDGSQPLDGTTQLSIPWGQLVFDYFTALPFENEFDPLAAPPEYTIPTNPEDFGDPSWPSSPDDDGDGDGFFARNDRGYTEYVDYLRANQPAVDLGYRVHGRININAAPWKVMQGLPLMPPSVMPIYKRFVPALDRFLLPGTLASWTWGQMEDPAGGATTGHMAELTFTLDASDLPLEQLGASKAQGLVAYRELREIVDPAWGPTGSYNILDLVGGDRVRKDGSLSMMAMATQRHTAGFLTVGELANVRNALAADSFFQMDNGQRHLFAGTRAQNYLFAVAPLVALGDWVTVKGHTFTAYGVLTAHGSVSEVNSQARRFEMVFDRSNVLVSDDPAERPDVLYEVCEKLSD